MSLFGKTSYATLALVCSAPLWAQAPAPGHAGKHTDHSHHQAPAPASEPPSGHGQHAPSAPAAGHQHGAPSAGQAGAGVMDHGSMQGGPPPADARDPHAYSGGYVLGPDRTLKMGDEQIFFSFMADRLERVRTQRNDSFSIYEFQAWVGKDYDRLMLKAEGEVEGGSIHEARTELLWSRAWDAFWNGQLGVRYDSGEGPNRSWLAFGAQGLAPYWFEIDAAFYLGEHGRTALRVEAEYELLLTQKLVLQPRAEVNFYGKRDPERELGSGLSDATFGVRLRYEILREFAPYIGIERADKFGRTAAIARAEGKKAEQTRYVAGVRFWF